ncbi:MAG: flagellar basal body rod protein FlgC [Gammaproteobacteria bacterium]|nr:flagellar basal body rod protein FlgC [Gammaproteobacteria bacterium]
MSLFGVFDVAGSALSAQSIRLNVTSSNLANAETVSSSTEKTYRARHPVFATVMDPFMESAHQAGVKVKGIVESKAELRMRYEPEHPLADAKGYIHLPNVNVVEEMANMISASRSYQSNVEVMNTAKQLMLATLRLGQ